MSKQFKKEKGKGDPNTNKINDDYNAQRPAQAKPKPSKQEDSDMDVDALYKELDQTGPF